MDLYFSPLACSLATRIAFYEAGYDARYVQVDNKLKRVEDGSEFFAINPLGQVPVLRTDDGTLLYENVAILPYVADHFPAAKLAPIGGFERARLQQWLGFISTELHKAVFVPMLDKEASDEVKRYAREHVPLRMGALQAHLASREWLLDRFSVADIYLGVVLNWARYCDIDLSQWPAVLGFFKRFSARPAAARGFEEELGLYRAELARQNG
ncbi:glutathione binding-like protein [Trinickia dinghuensis]|uniref:Glutathione S-transferase n=1 Tax=Trinickia dinghuensis TaxID=2291023 RepID=A0A3D8JSW0_9BURK|nr:glutathione binding-like protein [Trinickia dinghuensis]RDU96213.1 glutathione S-transferase [Trinickia dinghuensis]